MGKGKASSAPLSSSAQRGAAAGVLSSAASSGACRAGAGDGQGTSCGEKGCAAAGSHALGAALGAAPLVFNRFDSG
jgi:hypothetical protein